MRRFLLPYLSWILGAKYRSRQRLRKKYPTLALSGQAELRIEGRVILGLNVVVSERAKLVVIPKTCLTLGDETYVGRDVELAPGGLLYVGQRVSFQDRCIILGDVVIGSYSLFAFNVYISSGQHYHRHRPYLLIKDQDAEVLSTDHGRHNHSRPVYIGEDCWLGINTVVMAGVCVGRGAVVGANSVVTRDVAPYTVVAGSPAQLVGKRLDFCPPTYISWLNPKDIPYFYMGFDLANDQRESHHSIGGLVARQSFELWLEHTGAPLKLRIKSINAEPSKLSQGTQHWKIDGLHWIEIEVLEHQAGPTRFDLFGSPIAVEGAWTI